MHTPQILTSVTDSKTYLNSYPAKPAIIESYSQRFVQITHPLDILFTIEIHPNFYNTSLFHCTNYICQSYTNK